MPNRILKESICTSENIDELSAFEETVFYRLMVHCDDFGRFDARPKVLSSILFPLKNINPDDIANALKAMKNADLIELYEHNGKPYLHMKSWVKHQSVRAKTSKYPSPDDSDCEHVNEVDNTCKQMHADESKCPRIRIRNTYSNSKYENENDITSSQDEDAIPFVSEEKQTKQKKINLQGVLKEANIDGELLEAFNAFIEMRKAKKRPLTERALKMVITELNKLSSDPKEQVKIVNQSVLHTWDTVYALKGEQPKFSKFITSPADVEKIKNDDALAEWGGSL